MDTELPHPEPGKCPTCGHDGYIEFDTSYGDAMVASAAYCPDEWHEEPGNPSAQEMYERANR
jgi:hypothetical protein